MVHLNPHNLAGRCGLLALAVAAGWLLALVPALSLFGVAGLAAATFSAIVCLVPGCLVFWLISAAPPAAAQVRAVVAGTALRLVFALGGAWVMHAALGFSPQNYVVWLGFFYLIALAVETLLLLPARKLSSKTGFKFGA